MCLRSQIRLLWQFKDSLWYQITMILHAQPMLHGKLICKICCCNISANCRKAAEAGDAEAQAYLGHSYANGNGVQQNNATALSWFKSGAQGGSASAQFGLGYIYLHGHGQPRDYRLAYTYLKQAGEKVNLNISTKYWTLSIVSDLYEFCVIYTYLWVSTVLFQHSKRNTHCSF